MNEYQENYEKEISLVELMFYCLKKWRWIVCSMIIVAVLTGGYKYMSTAKNNQLQQQAFLESDEIGPVETIKNPRVRYYEQAIASSEQELEKQETYLRDSVVMQMDANHLQTGILSFYLNVMDDVDGNSLRSLAAAYKAYVTDGRLAKELFDVDDSIPIADLEYLLSFDKISLEDNKQSYLNLEIEVPIADLGQNIFQVQVVALNEEVCAAYLEKTKEAIMNYSAELKSEVAGHELRLLAAIQSEKTDEEIREYQAEILSSYAASLNNLKKLKEDMETVKTAEGDTIIVGQTANLANPVSAAVKFGIIGLVLGAFLAGFILILIYLMSGKLQSTEAFREEFGIQLLGEVSAPERKKKFFGFIDNWLYHLEEGAYANISREEQMRIVAASLKGAAKKEGLKKIMLTGTIAKEDVAGFCDCLKEHMQEIIFSAYHQIVFDATALEELDAYDAVVFLERKGVSYSKLIKKEREMVSGRDVQLLGTIIV